MGLRRLHAVRAMQDMRYVSTEAVRSWMEFRNERPFSQDGCTGQSAKGLSEDSQATATSTSEEQPEVYRRQVQASGRACVSWSGDGQRARRKAPKAHMSGLLGCQACHRLKGGAARTFMHITKGTAITSSHQSSVETAFEVAKHVTVDGTWGL